MTVTVVVLLTPARPPVIVTEVWTSTLLCVTLKVAFDFPAGTVTDTGPPAAAEFELARETFRPPVGAIPVRLTVPVTIVAATPFTDPGETEIDER